MKFASAGIIIQDKKILLVKRAANSYDYPNCWGCPAGGSEQGETPEETAIREVKEETNLEFKPRRLLFIWERDDFKAYRFLGDAIGEIKLQIEEISDYGFFSYGDAMKLEFAFDYKDVVERLKKEGLL